MLLKNLSKVNIQRLIVFGCFCVFFGMLFSKAVLSLSLVYFCVLSLLLGKESILFKQIRENNTLHYFLLFVGFYICSLFWSNDLHSSFSDIISKLHLIIFPIIWTILPKLESKNKTIILQLFAGMVILASLINFCIYQINYSPEKDIRSLALFVSHIRFSLFVSFTIFILLQIKTINYYQKIGIICCVLWLLFYTYYAQVLSGVLTLFIACIVLAINVLKSTHKSLKISALLFLLVTIISFTYLSINLFSNESKSILPKNLPKYTKLGHLYKHNLDSKAFENGYPLDCYINEQEMDSAWNLKSKIDLNSFDQNNFHYKTVLIRYLTSKGLTKDAEGVNKLTKSDIKNIEHGIPTILELKTGLQKRIYALKYELNSQQNPNGHSLLHRIEYWKTGWKIFQKNWLFGTGIGDYKNAYQKEYISQKSILEPKNRLESHNQFLGILIATGSIGLILFLLHITTTFYTFWNNKNKIAIAFYSICVASFLVEDTITTLAGMTFYSFFTGLFINISNSTNYK